MASDAAVAYHVFIVCLIASPGVFLIVCALLKRKPLPPQKMGQDYRPSIQPGRPGRANLRIAAKPQPDDRCSILQFKRRTH